MANSMPHHSFLAIVFALWGFLIYPAYAKKVELNIHQKADACFTDYDLTFPTSPKNCDAVCATCHTDMAVKDVSGQLFNPAGLHTDEVYTDVPEQTATDPWESLPEAQQSCRTCHVDYTENLSNHPIFKDVSDILTGDPSEELKAFAGIMLCATCHNPHKISPALLRKSNVGSALCRTCHAL